MREVGLQRDKKQLNDWKIGQDKTSLKYELNLIGVNIGPLIGHPQDNLDHKYNTEYKFRGYVEDNSHIILTIGWGD